MLEMKTLGHQIALLPSVLYIFPVRFTVAEDAFIAFATDEEYTSPVIFIDMAEDVVIGLTEPVVITPVMFKVDVVEIQAPTPPIIFPITFNVLFVTTVVYPPTPPNILPVIVIGAVVSIAFVITPVGVVHILETLPLTIKLEPL